MRDSRPSLYVYILTSLCVIVLYVLEWQDLIGVVKPAIVPAIFYYYIQTTNRPVSILFSASLWLFFVADMVEVVDEAQGIYLIMACGLMSYLIMFSFALRDKVSLYFNFKSILAAVAISIMSCLVCFYIIINSTIGTSDYLFFLPTLRSCCNLHDDLCNSQMVIK